MVFQYKYTQKLIFEGVALIPVMYYKVSIFFDMSSPCMVYKSTTLETRTCLHLLGVRLMRFHGVPYIPPVYTTEHDKTRLLCAYSVILHTID